MLARLRWMMGPPLVTARGLGGTCGWLDLPALAWRVGSMERHVACPHSMTEIVTIARAILARSRLPGDIAEFGCFKGGSTARLSLVCAKAGKRLIVFDSFAGLPDPEAWDAEHQIERPRVFRRGEYAGTLDEVRENVRRFGRLDLCSFVPGWIAETVQPALAHEAISVAFIDVDLVASTRDALEGVWPRLVGGGVAFVHDATDAKLAGLLQDATWWRSFAEQPSAVYLPAANSGSTLATLFK